MSVRESRQASGQVNERASEQASGRASESGVVSMW